MTMSGRETFNLALARHCAPAAGLDRSQCHNTPVENGLLVGTQDVGLAAVSFRYRFLTLAVLRLGCIIAARSNDKARSGREGNSKQRLAAADVLPPHIAPAGSPDVYNARPLRRLQEARSACCFSLSYYNHHNLDVILL